MDIVLINEKVTFQKNSVVTDVIGNHTNAWESYYSCFATIGGEGLASSKEQESAGTVVEDTSMTVTVRYCAKAAAITTTEYRLIFKDAIYDITNVAHMNFKKKCLKFSCRKVRR